MAILRISILVMLASCVHRLGATCRFEPQNVTLVRNRVSEILKESGAKLVRYNAVFVNYTDSVMTDAGGDLFRPTQWIRTVNRQGNNLLMFDDNFEMLSLGLLGIGVYNVDLKLVDVPRGCINSLKATERMNQMRSLLLTDFRNTSTTVNEKDSDVYERICNKRVFVPQVASGDRSAEFAYMCCHRDGQSDIQCADIKEDTWIVVLDYILGCAIIVFMLYCPKLFSIVIGEQRSDEITDFTARLPHRDNCTVHVEKENGEIFINNGRAKLSLDGMEKANRYLSALGDTTTVDCRIVDITVSVPRESLFALGCYPVSIFRVLYDGIFHCRFGRSATFNPCCSALVCCKQNTPCQCRWFAFFRIVGKLLLLLMFCVPFIIEFVVYYIYITPMFDKEKAACDKINATCAEHKKGLDLLGVRYLSKFSVAIYACITLVSGLIVEFVLGRFLNRTAVFSSLLVKSQTEMRLFPIIRVLVHTILTPFKDHGLLGFVLCPIYIPKIFWYLIYSFLAIFPLVKIIFGLLQFIVSITYNKYKGKKRLWRIIIESILYLIVYYVFLASLLVLVIFCITFYTEIFFYTLIGVIANANLTLPFVAMLLPLGVYTRQILGKVGEVYKNFLSLISQVILSRNVDENGELARHDIERYKRTVLLIQSFSTESPTDINKSLTDGDASDEGIYYEGSWLLLFLEKAKDSDDDISTYSEIADNTQSNRRRQVLEMVLPSRTKFQKNIRKPHYHLGKYYIYTPADLFYDIVDLDLPGSPGPIRSVILTAFVRLLVVAGFLAFVVIAVMGLGATYKITLTDQLMLTVVGGVIPLIFRYGLFNYRMSSVDWDNEELKLNVIKAMALWSEKWKILDMTLLSSAGSPITSPDDVDVDLAPKEGSEDCHEVDEGDELYKKPDAPPGAVCIPMNDLAQPSSPTV